MKVLRTFIGPGARMYLRGEEYPREGEQPSPETLDQLIREGLIEGEPEEPKKKTATKKTAKK